MGKLSSYGENTAPALGDFLLGDTSATNTTNRFKIQNLRGPLTAKRVSPNVSPAAPAPNFDTTDIFAISALANAAAFAAPTGTPADGQVLNIRIKDNGTAQALTFNAIYRPIGVTLPTTTVANKVLYLGGLWNAQDSTFDILSVGRQQ
jgi:hypothetical protein